MIRRWLRANWLVLRRWLRANWLVLWCCAAVGVIAGLWAFWVFWNIASAPYCHGATAAPPAAMDAARLNLP